jgi:hypothetical protein
MAAGVYASARFATTPKDDVLGSLFRGDVTVCHHDDICGGIFLECSASTEGVAAYSLHNALERAGGREVRVITIRCIEWFNESMLSAGGRTISWDAVHKRTIVAYGPTETHSKAWWASRGWLAFHTDFVDIAHPQAMHATTSAQEFDAKLNKLWELV